MQRFAFEQHAFERHGDSSEHDSRDDAANILTDMLVELKFSGSLSAKDVCVLMFYARICGLECPAVDFAYKPESLRAHFNRHFNIVLGFGQALEQSYTLRVPGYNHMQGKPCTMEVPCFPAHELLDNELIGSPELEEQLSHGVANNEWTEQYKTHPVVRGSRNGEHVWPCALYCDKVPFLKRDSALVFYMYNLVSKVRHLIIVLRASEMCQCGCHGWCTLFPVFAWIRWSLDSLKTGLLPLFRHDGSDFTADDDARAAIADDYLRLGGSHSHIWSARLV